jgi:hypothetical protein
MSNVQLAVATRNALLDDGIDGLFDSGTLKIYDGSQPATGDTAVSGQTVLATITLPATAFGAAASGVISKSGTWEDTSADAGGTATWFRFETSGAANIFDGDVSTVAAGTGDLQLDNTSITATQTVTINTFTITMPAS